VAGGESRYVPIEEASVARYFFPRLSEDGRWLLFQNGNLVEVVAAAGGKPTVLMQGEYPAWGAGSRSIVYTNNLSGKGRTLWEVPFSGERGELSGPARPITLGRGADLGAAASRDGSAIAYAVVDNTLNLEDVAFDAEAGRVLGAPRELTTGDNHVGLLDPAPDGRAVAYAAAGPEGSLIWRAEYGSPPLQLSRERSWIDANPAWSPDGRSIAFYRSRADSRTVGSVWIMNADGTSPRLLTDVDGLGQAAWLPDARALLISRGRDVLRFDLASGQTTPVPGADGRTLYVVDGQGKWLAFQTSDRGSMHISAVPIAGGAPRVIYDAGDNAFHPFFSPSGRWLYFQSNHKNLFRIPGPAQDWRSAPPEKVTDFTGLDLYIDGPKVSADGSRLFYARGRSRAEVIVLQRTKPGGPVPRS